jgi:hypothetical protein
VEPRAAQAGPWHEVPLASRATYDRRTGVHRPFFRSGIVVLLTAGAAWGAVLLLRISVSGSFTAPSIHDVNAHGHAQIFGWVGLFVMGFAYQMFVHWRTAGEIGRRAVALSLALMIGGLVLRVLGEPLHGLPALRALAVAGALAEAVAIGLFAVVIAYALRAPGRVIPAERPYVVAALALFFAQAVYEAVLLVATTGARDPRRLLEVVSTWQAPLRDLQIHGFALLMILGVGLWLFPRTFGLRRPRRSVVTFGWAAILVAVAGESVGFVLMRLTGNHAWAGLLYGAILLLAGTSAALTWHWLPGLGPARVERSVKFVRAACVWLAISMSMLVLAPVYMFVVLPAGGGTSESGLRALEIGFSHAYYGAARHAITVGFVSLTIMGVGARIVPMLGGLSTRRLGALGIPFVLLNVGCALRVGLQVATDFLQPAFAWVGVSGILEVAGLALWGAHMWRIMAGKRMVSGPERALVPSRGATV